MNITSNRKAISLSASVILSAVVLTGCGGSNDSVTTPPPPADTRSFSVNVLNLTENQPMSPIGAVLHKTGYHAWNAGSAASVALEYLAEGGDNSFLVSAADANAATLATSSGPMPVGPGHSDLLQLTAADDGADAYLSVFTMLVNSNDAFTGVNAVKLGDLAVGESVSVSVPAWDAGSEDNSEALGSLPGPADGGEGFNAVRDDLVDLVTIHRGVVSADDGFTTSILNQSHRFDNPVAHVMITRTE